MIGYIYQGKVYIGCSIQKKPQHRWLVHVFYFKNGYKKQSAPLLYAHFEQYGTDDIEWAFLETVEVNSRLELQRIYESKWITSIPMELRLSSEEEKAHKSEAFCEKNSRSHKNLQTGEKNGRAKLTPSRVAEIRKRYLRGEGPYKMSKDFPEVKQAIISKICRNKFWTDLEYQKLLDQRR